MKNNLLLFISLFIFSFYSISQSVVYEFGYDECGNRTRRTSVIIPPAPSAMIINHSDSSKKLKNVLKNDSLIMASLEVISRPLDSNSKSNIAIQGRSDYKHDSIYRYKKVVASTYTVNDSIKGAYDKIGKYKFTLYPNPTLGDFFIKIDPLFLDEKNKELALFDSKGNIIKKTEISSNLLSINMYGLASGSYLVKITSSNYSASWRVIKK